MSQIKPTLPKWVDVLFARFTAIYRDKWTADLINNDFIWATKWEWASDLSLRHADLEVIDKAIDLCKHHLEWPPTIAKFVEFVNLARDELLREMERNERLNALPKQKSIEIEKNSYVDFCQKLKKENPDLSWPEIFEIAKGESIL